VRLEGVIRFAPLYLAIHIPGAHTVIPSLA